MSRCPSFTGPELQQALAAQSCPRPIIFLSGRADISISVQAMKDGATDFLTKPVRDEVLLAAVRAAFEKDRVARIVRAELAGITARLATLTPREHEVLEHVVAGRLNKQIADALGTVEQTIKVHRARVMEKMQVQSVADLVRLVERLGGAASCRPTFTIPASSRPTSAPPASSRSLKTSKDGRLEAGARDVGRQDAAPPIFFDPHSEIRHTQSRLPHWQQEHATYFITFHLGDSVPKSQRDRWQEERDAWLQLHPPPHTPEQTSEYHRRFTGEMEQWLDAGHGSCVLRRQECAALVADTLRHFDGERYRLAAWVVMPNHVHALLAPTEPWTLEQILHSWKSFSANRVNKLLRRTGSLWQRDYFDRLIRDERHFANCLRYIRENPAKSQLNAGEYLASEDLGGAASSRPTSENPASSSPSQKAGG